MATGVLVVHMFLGGGAGGVCRCLHLGVTTRRPLLWEICIREGFGVAQHALCPLSPVAVLSEHLSALTKRIDKLNDAELHRIKGKSPAAKQRCEGKNVTLNEPSSTVASCFDKISPVASSSFGGVFESPDYRSWWRSTFMTLL